MTTLLHIFFVVLNSSLYLAIAAWFVRNHVIPCIRASLAMEAETSRSLSENAVKKRTELNHVQAHYAQQEREIARLMACMEQWAGVLSQRAAGAEQEMRELAFRYRARCENNARARVTENTNRIVVNKVLKNARVALTQEYAQLEKQRQYIDGLRSKIIQKDTHDRT